MRRMSADQLDLQAVRLEKLEAEYDQLREELKAQVAEYGSTPARAEKSKRLTGNLYQFTVSEGSSTEIKDTEVLRLKEVCEPAVFEKLYREETVYKQSKGFQEFLAGTLPKNAPRNLRQLFARTYTVKPKGPSLTIKKLETTEA